MRRTNIYLDDAQLAALRSLGSRQDRPVAELVREAVDEWLQAHGVTPVADDEWALRFGRLLERRSRLASEHGWTPETVDDDVSRAVAETRSLRAANRR